MKKFLLVLVILAIVGGAAFAFDVNTFPSPIEKGSVLISPGFGLGSYWSAGAGWGISTAFGGALAVDYALPINFALTLGAEAGFLYSSLDWGISSASGSLTTVPIMFRIAWHPNFEVKGLDVYAMLKLGFALGFWGGDAKKYGGNDVKNPNGFAWGTQVGVRYFFTDNIGIFGEFGLDRYNLKAKYTYDDYYGLYTYTVTERAHITKFLSIGVTFKI